MVMAKEGAFLFRVQAGHGEAQFIEGNLINMGWSSVFVSALKVRRQSLQR
jgi:hypothetical protein